MLVEAAVTLSHQQKTTSVSKEKHEISKAWTNNVFFIHDSCTPGLIFIKTTLKTAELRLLSKKEIEATDNKTQKLLTIHQELHPE